MAYVIPSGSAVAAAPLVAIGFGRFAYALVLPQMRSDLGWSYTTAGLATTVNAIGYLLGALLVAPLADRIGVKRTFLLGWAVTAVAIGATGLTRTTPYIMLARGVAGLASGVLYVAGASLAAHLASQLRIRPGISLGFYQAGAGAGIGLSGIFAVFVLAIPRQRGWQPMWIVLGLASLAALCTVMRTVARVREPRQSRPREAIPRAASMTRITPTVIGYFLFGLGYIAYMTFVVALLQSGHSDPSTTTAFWIVLGVSAIAGSLVWGRILDGVRGGLGPAGVLAVTPRHRDSRDRPCSAHPSVRDVDSCDRTSDGSLWNWSDHRAFARRVDIRWTRRHTSGPGPFLRFPACGRRRICDSARARGAS